MTYKTISVPGEYMYVSESEVYGGKSLSISFAYQFEDDLKWLRKHRLRMELEAKAREENESVRSAYEQYQTVLNLVLDQV
jgi:hypothetical protein